MLPWPWFRGRIVIEGDAAHTFPQHLTQGAAMAVEGMPMSSPTSDRILNTRVI